MWRRRLKGKYGNVTRSVCTLGHSHRSKLESAVCAIMYLRMKSGEFKEILIEQSVYLTEARIQYIPDFACEKPSGLVVYVEAKGMETPEWRIKRRLWMHYGCAPLEVWKGTAAKPVLHEIICPKGAL